MRFARDGDQRGQLGQRFDRYEDGADGQRRAGHAVRHPHGNGGRLVILLAEPHVTTVAQAPLHENRLAMQRVPAIMHDDVLSTVGRIYLARMPRRCAPTANASVRGFGH